MGSVLTRHLRATCGVAVPQFPAVYAESQDERLVHGEHPNDSTVLTDYGALAGS